MIDLTSKAKILVLFANAYEMKDDNGREMSGCSVHYLFWGEGGENLGSLTEFDVSKPVGVQRAKVSLDKDARRKLAVAPAIYEGSFQMTVGSDGKPVLKLVDVAYLCNVEMKEKVLPGLVIPGMVEPQKEK